MREKQLQLFNFDEEQRLKRHYTITLPLDTFILLVIVVILLFIFSFSLGVEKGRKIAYLNAERRGDLASLNIRPSSLDNYKVNLNEETQVKEKPAISLEEEIKNTVEEAKSKKTSLPQRNKEDKNTKKYVIQVASYLNMQRAQEEAKKLENKGYPVSVSKKGKFIVVLVGEFKDKDEAQKNKRSLKQTYTDCILRSI